MVLDILQVGEAVLRQPARLLTAAEVRSPAIQELIEHMRETMRAAPGVGLAAPQIGASLQLAVIEDSAENLMELSPERLAELDRHPVPFQVIVNPVITLGEESVEFFEGCLSVARFGAAVPRARTVVVDCWNERAEPVRIEAAGWHARILQHEIDHLSGSLYIDRMHPRSFMTIDNHRRYWKDTPLAQVREALGWSAPRV
jgi:peptide deformylase